MSNSRANKIKHILVRFQSSALSLAKRDHTIDMQEFLACCCQDIWTLLRMHQVDDKGLPTTSFTSAVFQVTSALSNALISLQTTISTSEFGKYFIELLEKIKALLDKFTKENSREGLVKLYQDFVFDSCIVSELQKYRTEGNDESTLEDIAEQKLGISVLKNSKPAGQKLDWERQSFSLTVVQQFYKVRVVSEQKKIVLSFSHERNIVIAGGGCETDIVKLKPRIEEILDVLQKVFTTAKPMEKSLMILFLAMLATLQAREHDEKYEILAQYKAMVLERQRKLEPGQSSTVDEVFIYLYSAIDSKDSLYLMGKEDLEASIGRLSKLKEETSQFSTPYNKIDSDGSEAVTKLDLEFGHCFTNDKITTQLNVHCPKTGQLLVVSVHRQDNKLFCSANDQDLHTEFQRQTVFASLLKHLAEAIEAGRPDLYAHSILGLLFYARSLPNAESCKQQIIECIKKIEGDEDDVTFRNALLKVVNDSMPEDFAKIRQWFEKNNEQICKLVDAFQEGKNKEGLLKKCHEYMQSAESKDCKLVYYTSEDRAANRSFQLLGIPGVKSESDQLIDIIVCFMHKSNGNTSVTTHKRLSDNTYEKIIWKDIYHYLKEHCRSMKHGLSSLGHCIQWLCVYAVIVLVSCLTLKDAEENLKKLGDKEGPELEEAKTLLTTAQKSARTLIALLKSNSSVRDLSNFLGEKDKTVDMKALMIKTITTNYMTLLSVEKDLSLCTFQEFCKSLMSVSKCNLQSLIEVKFSEEEISVKFLHKYKKFTEVVNIVAKQSSENIELTLVEPKKLDLNGLSAIYTHMSIGLELKEDPLELVLFLLIILLLEEKYDLMFEFHGKIQHIIALIDKIHQDKKLRFSVPTNMKDHLDSFKNCLETILTNNSMTSMKILKEFHASCTVKAKRINAASSESLKNQEKHSSHTDDEGTPLSHISRNCKNKKENTDIQEGDEDNDSKDASKEPEK